MQYNSNFNTRIRNIQNAFAETMEIFDTKDLNRKENKELLVKNCMSLTMECISAHIFVALDYQEPVVTVRNNKVQADEMQEIEELVQKERGDTVM